MRRPVKQVFLSYSRADEPAARQILSHLEDAGFEVWYPDRDLLPGANWAESMDKALKNSDAMVVLLSPQYSQSNQRHEVEYALTSERFSGRLIPVLLRKTKDYPWILDNLQTMIRDQSPRHAARSVVELLTQGDDATKAVRAR